MVLTYDGIVQNLLNIPLIKEYVETEENRGNFLNLISPDWKKRLIENEVYQRHVNDNNGDLFFTLSKNDRVKQVIRNPNDKMYIMLAFPCKITNVANLKSFAVSSRNSEPLSIIAEALTSDKGNDCNLIKEFTLLTRMCDVNRCEECKDFKNIFKAAGYSISCNNPCICKTWLYDENQIVSRFASIIKSELNVVNFMTIMQVEIDMRLMYHSDNTKQNIRIGGNIINMLFMEENLVTTNMEIKKPILGELKPKNNENDGKRKQNGEHKQKQKKMKFATSESTSDNFDIPFDEMNREYDEQMKREDEEMKKKLIIKPIQ